MRHKSRTPVTSKMERDMMEASRQIGSRTDAKELRQKRVQKAAFFEHVKTCKTCARRYAQAMSMSKGMHTSGYVEQIVNSLLQGVSETEEHTDHVLH